VKDRNDIDRIARLTKHNDVWESAKQRAARRFVDRRELFWVISDSRERGTQGVTKLRHEASYKHGFSEISPRCSREEYPNHLPRPPIELGVDLPPRDRISAIRVEGRKPAV
jgi:hypothetical protein